TDPQAVTSSTSAADISASAPRLILCNTGNLLRRKAAASFFDPGALLSGKRILGGPLALLRHHGAQLSGHVLRRAQPGGLRNGDGHNQRHDACDRIGSQTVDHSDRSGM
ncbi:MAG TPA: hypothetical protein VLJ86_17385, partial [Ramlibacter sp.]|nr:hypothetical protein [Ramlibacter sp.]